MNAFEKLQLINERVAVEQAKQARINGAISRKAEADRIAKLNAARMSIYALAQELHKYSKGEIVYNPNHVPQYAANGKHQNVLKANIMPFTAQGMAWHPTALPPFKGNFGMIAFYRNQPEVTNAFEVISVKPRCIIMKPITLTESDMLDSLRMKRVHQPVRDLVLQLGDFDDTELWPAVAARLNLA